MLGMLAFLTLCSAKEVNTIQVGEEAGLNSEHLARTHQLESDNQVSTDSGRLNNNGMQVEGVCMSKHLRQEIFKIFASQFLEEIHEICAVDRSGSGEDGARSGSGEDGAAAAASSQVLLPYLTTGTANTCLLGFVIFNGNLLSS
jgi:hypothetical protein